MRRLDADLRHIVDLEPASFVCGRLDARGGIFENVVEHAGRDAHGVLVRYGVDHFKELVDPLTGQRGDEQHRRVGHIAQVAADIVRHLLHRVRVFFDHVPLVDDDDARLACLVRKPGDLGVLLGDALVSVDQNQAHVRALNRGNRAQVRIFFHRVVDLRLAAHTGGIDKQVLAELVFKVAVDGVARCARNVGDNHAFLAQNAVEKARLADVRLADDRNLDHVLVVFLVVRVREVFHTGVQNIARAVPMDRGNLNRVSETKRIKLIDLRVNAARAVALVDCQNDGLFGLFEHRRNLAVGCGKPHGDVHDHDNDRRGFDGDFRLSAHEFQHLAVGTRLNAAGINEGKAAPVPVAFAVNPVARHAWRIFHNCHALAGQLIEEHRLADVRSTHDCYNRFCHRNYLPFTQRQTLCAKSARKEGD